MSRVARALVLGALTATVGVLLTFLPVTLHLEEALGLDLLFRLRGARPAPPEAVVVSIDKESADALDLPPDPARWPRSFHARLVDRLSQEGAAVIVFDIAFDAPGAPEEDRVFADALSRAGNVVLAEYLTRETVPVPGAPGAPAGQMMVEQRVPPAPALADAALALAPFPLPKVPVRVSQYWTFKPDAGDTPTLPVVALQVFALERYRALRRLLETVSPDQARALPPDAAALRAGGHVERLVRALREALQHEARRVGTLPQGLRGLPPGDVDSGERRVLDALLRLYVGPSSRYLNFYGPPGTIPAIPYHRVLLPDASRGPPVPDVRGKAVFVGLADTGASRQKDGFYTVFSQASGLDLSGVEIAATAFGNLLAASPVEPVAPAAHLVVVLLWGLAVGLVGRLLTPSIAVPAVLSAGVLYLLAARSQFVAADRWYPLVTPLLVQVPLAALGAVLWSYAETHRERRNIRQALGYYLPADVADRVARNLGDVRAGSALLYGTCLSTDAHQYTTLAETMGPAELGALMNRYYAAMFEPVKQHGGIVQDVVGDSMLAIWASERADAGLRHRACLAALDIAGAVDRFNREAGGAQLPTRIGLHSGELLLGNVGAMDHYEYRAVGDIVNTATRLENLNKYVATRILVSREVVEGLEGLHVRPLGAFLLVGKSRPVDVYELRGRTADAAPDELGWCATFAEALEAYRRGSLERARTRFEACLRIAGEDGPARFFVSLCEQHLRHPPGEPWDGVVRMERK